MLFITGQFLHNSNTFSYKDEMHPFEQDKTFHNFGRKTFSAFDCNQKSFNYNKQKFNYNTLINLKHYNYYIRFR